MQASIPLFLLVAFTGAALAADCHKTVISHHHLAKNFEPSDSVWDEYSQRLWVVSDGGDLASMTYDGSSITYWSFPDKPDLEGIVKIPGREEYIYLQSEVTQQLIEFDPKLGKVNAIYQLHGPGHLEAVTWVQVNHSAAGLLYAGGQAAGTVHVHSLDFEKGKANFVEQFSLPAPNPGDLSALHYHVDWHKRRECLTAVYDRHKLMVLYVRNLGAKSNKDWRSIKKWQMPDVGSEGIAWATVQGENYFFVCIDTAKSTVPKERAVHRYNADYLDECFDATMI